MTAMDRDTDTSEQAEANRGEIVVSFGGEELSLLPERGVWWPAERTVFIADTHFGKAATFRAAAIPIPDSTDQDLRVLDRILDRTAATTLVVLGDLLHARRGRCATTFASIAEWRERRAAVAMHLIRGNHDVGAGAPPKEWQIEIHSADTRRGPFVLSHYPNPTGHPTLAGHLHPKIRMEFGGDQLKLPCYLVREEVLVLPAFTNFADHGEIRRQPGDLLYAIAEDEVFSV